MAVLYTDHPPYRAQSVQERFHAELADRIPGSSSVGIVYMQQIPNVYTITEIPLSPRMARFKKAGLLGCFDGTGVNSENYRDFL